MKRTYLLIIIFLVTLLAGVLRIYKLDKIPPSLNWDEVAAGYNAYTIFHWGKDEWGKTLPLVFTSFRDDKHPVHIYLTAPIVGIFGLTDFNARLSSALLGIVVVVAVFFLAKYMFDSVSAGVFASLFMTLSPYHIHYSRGLWEANFALSFFLVGLMLFFVSLSKKPKLMPYSYLGFGVCLLCYHSSKVVAFPLVLLLTVLYLKKLIALRKHFYVGLAIFFSFVLLIICNPRLLGTERAKQTKFSEEMIKNTSLYERTANTYLGLGEVVFENWKKYFNYDYLLVRGDQNPRGSMKTVGQFLYIDALLVPIGVGALVLRKKKILLFLLSWLALAPIPGAISSQTPNATRSIFILGVVILMSAYGAGVLYDLVKPIYLKVLVALLVVGVISYQSYIYLGEYFSGYSKENAIEWQYGMKQMVEYLAENPDYYKVYVDKVRQQPYIFFLYYLKYPLPDFLKTVKYEQTESKSFNTVLSFDKYQFGGWNWVESYPTNGILYILEPSKYSGLRFINDFEVVKLIKYPSRNDAFFLVGGGW